MEKRPLVAGQSNVPVAAKLQRKTPIILSGVAAKTLQVVGGGVLTTAVKSKQAIKKDKKTKDSPNNKEAPIVKTFINQNVQIVTSALNGLPGSTFVGYQCSVCYAVFTTYAAFNAHQLAQQHYKENLNLEKSNKDVVVRCIDCFNGQLESCKRCKIFAGNERCCRKLLGSLQCSQCTGIFSSRDTFNKHPCISSKNQPKAASQGVELEESFNCNVCLQEFPTKIKLRNHMRKHKTPAAVSFNAGTSSEAGASMKNVWQCASCNCFFNSAVALMGHECINNIPYICDSCGTQVQGYEAYRLHAKKCRENSGTGDTVIQPLTHTRIELVEVQEEDEKHGSSGVGAKKKYKSSVECVLCNKVLKDKQALERHMKNHLQLGSDASVRKKEKKSRGKDAESRDNAFKCNICGRTAFKSLSGVNIHKNSHTGKLFMCSFCGKLLKGYEGAEKHMSTHKEEMSAEQQQQLENGELYEFLQQVEDDNLVMLTGTHNDIEEEMTSNEKAIKGQEEINKTKTGHSKEELNRALKDSNRETGDSSINSAKKDGSNTSGVEIADKKPSSESSELSKKGEREVESKTARVEEKQRGDDAKNTDPAGSKDCAAKAKLQSQQKMSHKVWKCTKCYKSFATSGGLLVHKQQKHKKKVYTCPICNKQLQSSLKVHMARHRSGHVNEKGQRQRPGKPARRKGEYACSLCPKIFASSTGLKQHEEHHQGNTFACTAPGCDRSYSMQSSLKKHIQKHHVVGRIHQCTQCGKRFFQKTDLSLHMRTHTGEKPFTCKICQQPFRYRSSLYAHVRSHLNIRRYQCTRCESKFSCSKSLKKHALTHSLPQTPDKQYRCAQCGSCFTRRHALMQHQRIHYSGKVRSTSSPHSFYQIS